MPGGRPTDYREEYVEQAYKLALLGMTDAEMAVFFEVDERTVNRWKDAHPEFCQSLARGKGPADGEIAASLYHRAKGYSHPDVHISSYEGDITITEIVKHYPPDTQAASLWLRNRQPAKWRDKQEHELTGKDRGPIEIAALTPEERAQRAAAIIDEAFAPPAVKMISHGGRDDGSPPDDGGKR